MARTKSEIIPNSAHIHRAKIEIFIPDDQLVFYSIEITTKEGLDIQKIKDLVWNKIGEIPDIDNHGTYFRIEHALTLEALKQLSDYEFVLSVKGSYTGPYYF